MAQPARPQKIIDAHVHLLQPSHFQYHWLKAGSALDRDFHLNEVREEMRALNVAGVIVIEATNSPQEIGWLLDKCASEPFIKGVIGGIDLEQIGAERHLHYFGQFHNFKGVRLNWFTPRRESRQFGV